MKAWRSSRRQTEGLEHIAREEGIVPHDAVDGPKLLGDLPHEVIAVLDEREHLHAHLQQRLQKRLVFRLALERGLPPEPEADNAPLGVQGGSFVNPEDREVAPGLRLSSTRSSRNLTARSSS